MRPHISPGVRDTGWEEGGGADVVINADHKRGADTLAQ